MALVRLMGFLGLLLLFPMHVFGLTYRINQSAGESYHVPTPSGSASLVFRSQKGKRPTWSSCTPTRIFRISTNPKGLQAT